MQTSSTQAEVLDDVKDLDGLLKAAELLFLRDDQINVDIGMDEITIGGAANSSLDAHQAVLFGALEDCFRFQLLRVTGLVDIRAYPADVLAPAESPLLQAVAAHVQALRGAAPEEYKRAVSRNLAHIQIWQKKKVTS